MLSFFCLQVALFAAAEEEHFGSGLRATPVTIMLPKKVVEKNQGIVFTVVRSAMSKNEVKLKKIICVYMESAVSETSKKIRSLLRKIKKENPYRLEEIIDSFGLYGCNLFHVAATKNDKKLVKILLKYHPAILNAQTLAHNTALHLAYRYGAKKVISFLEKQKTIDTTITNLDEQTAQEMPYEIDKPLNETEGFSIKKSFKNKKLN